MVFMTLDIEFTGFAECRRPLFLGCQHEKFILETENSVLEAHICLQRALSEIYVTHPAPEVCVVGGGTKSDPEDGVSWGVSVIGEIFDPGCDSGCIRMPLGRSPKWSQFGDTSAYPQTTRY